MHLIDLLLFFEKRFLFFYVSEDFSNLDYIPFFVIHFRHDAGTRRRHVEGRLIGRYLDEILAFLDPVAFFEMPVRDRDFPSAFSHIRHDHLCHNLSSLRLPIV